MTSRRALWTLIAVSGLIRLAWAASLGVGNDEAYYYLFSVHRDWSYFDQPPMLAIVERLGIAISGGVVSPFSLRLGFVLLFGASTWLLDRLTARYYGDRAGFLAALALNLTAYPTSAAACFALPDGPLVFFWLLTLDRLALALESPGALRPWIGVGLAWGGALLSKYHAVFLPAGTLLYLVLAPAHRPWLKRTGPYLAIGCGLLLFSPVLWWNATHSWASFAFQGGRAIGSLTIRPVTLLAAIAGQALYLFPWMWIALVGVLFGALRRASSGGANPADRFLVCQAVVPLSVFLAVACTRAVLPHWTLVGFLSVFPMLGRVWAGRPARPLARRLAGFTAVPVVVAGFVVLETHTGLLQQGGTRTLGLLKVSRDPTLDLYGWDDVGRELKRRGLLDRPDTFLFTCAWYYSGHLAFATRGHQTPVACYSSGDARGFRFWSRPDDWLGRDGILVSLNGHSAEPHCYDRYFDRIEALGEFAVDRAGAPVRKVRLFRCVRQARPFPFDAPAKLATERATAARAGVPGPSMARR